MKKKQPKQPEPPKEPDYKPKRSEPDPKKTEDAFLKAWRMRHG